MYWIGPDGSKTRFSETFTVTPGTAAHTYLDNRTIDATDSSFLRLETGHYFNGDPDELTTTRKPAILYFPNGTTLTFERDTDAGTVQPRRWTMETVNGNAVSAVGSTGTMAGNGVNLYDVLADHRTRSAARSASPPARTRRRSSSPTPTGSPRPTASIGSR